MAPLGAGGLSIMSWTAEWYIEQEASRSMSAISLSSLVSSEKIKRLLRLPMEPSVLELLKIVSQVIENGTFVLWALWTFLYENNVEKGQLNYLEIGPS